MTTNIYNQIILGLDLSYNHCGGCIIDAPAATIRLFELSTPVNDYFETAEALANTICALTNKYASNPTAAVIEAPLKYTPKADTVIALNYLAGNVRGLIHGQFPRTPIIYQSNQVLNAMRGNAKAAQRKKDSIALANTMVGELEDNGWTIIVSTPQANPKTPLAFSDGPAEALLHAWYYLATQFSQALPILQRSIFGTFGQAAWVKQWFPGFPMPPKRPKK